MGLIENLGKTREFGSQGPPLQRSKVLQHTPRLFCCHFGTFWGSNGSPKWPQTSAYYGLKLCPEKDLSHDVKLYLNVTFSVPCGPWKSCWNVPPSSKISCSPFSWWTASGHKNLPKYCQKKTKLPKLQNNVTRKSLFFGHCFWCLFGSENGLPRTVSLPTSNLACLTFMEQPSWWFLFNLWHVWVLTCWHGFGLVRTCPRIAKMCGKDITAVIFLWPTHPARNRKSAPIDGGTGGIPQ